MDSPHFEKDDVLECLLSAKGPVTKDYLRSKLPWINDLDATLNNMVYTGLLNCYTTQFSSSPPMEPESPTSSQLENVTLFAPSTSALSPRHLEIPATPTSRNFTEAMNILKDTIERHGLHIFPTTIFPTTTASSLESDLETLRALRNTYASQLDSVTHARNVANNPSTGGAGKSKSNRSTMTTTRDEDIQRKKAVIKGELKELLHVLAGMLADHRNESLAEVIQEYKSR